MSGTQDRIGPYVLRGELGRGAMARVWRAWDPNLEREVAIKEPLFDPRYPQSVIDELARRFVGEGRAAARLNHKGIVTIYAADVYDGRPAIVMELVHGETLSSALRRGPFDPARALSSIVQLLEAVRYAHAHGVVHRDIKPDNIFVTPDGTVKLADFGIASVEGSAGTMGTMAGSVLGTPGYMSPEQAKGMGADARSDLFSVGVVSYEMLTGRNPFGVGSGVDATTMLYRIVHEPVPDLPPSAVAGLPEGLRPAIMAALAKNPAERPQSAEEFRAMIWGQTITPGQTGAIAGSPYDTSAATRMVMDADGSIGAGGVDARWNTGALPDQRYVATGAQGTPPVQQTGGPYPGMGGQVVTGGQVAVGGGRNRTPSWLPYAIVAGVAMLVLGFVFINAIAGGGGGRGVAGTANTTTSAEESSSSTGSTYYLAVSDGKVAIFSNSSATPYEVGDVEVSDLGSDSREELDAHVPASSVEEAEDLLEGYRQEAEANRKEREAQEAQAALEADIAAHPFTISGTDCSSYLSSEGQASHYESGCVIDNDFTTAWNESGSNPSGIGEWVSINASSEQWAHGLTLVNGYPKTEDIYYKNNRCRDVTITLSDGFSMQVTLLDLYREWQSIDFGDYHKTSYIRVTINSVYEGNTWLDTAICEMRAY